MHLQMKSSFKVVLFTENEIDSSLETGNRASLSNLIDKKLQNPNVSLENL